MNTEKYHSLAAYDIHLIVPGCESPLELRRCSDALRGWLCTGTRPLAPRASSSCWSETQSQLSFPPGLRAQPCPTSVPLQKPQQQAVSPGFAGKGLNA